MRCNLDRLVLETTAGSPLADPAERASASLGLLVGHFPPSTIDLEAAIADSYSTPNSKPLDVQAVIAAMRRLP